MLDHVAAQFCLRDSAKLLSGLEFEPLQKIKVLLSPPRLTQISMIAPSSKACSEKDCLSTDKLTNKTEHCFYTCLAGCKCVSHLFIHTGQHCPQDRDTNLFKSEQMVYSAVTFSRIGSLGLNTQVLHYSTHYSTGGQFRSVFYNRYGGVVARPVLR